MKNCRYVSSSTNSKVRVLSALKAGKQDVLSGEDKGVIDLVLSALEDQDGQIARAASIYIIEQRDRNIIDLVCNRWIENPTQRTESIIRQNNYEPSDTKTKVIFYFLLGEWQKYDNLDFDKSLLAKAYTSGSPELQKRITKKSRKEGRFELIKILTDTKNGFNVKPMEYRDWQACVDILASQIDGRQIWKFLYNAPAFWSKRLLDKLIQVPSNQFKKTKKDTFNSVFNLAKSFEERDFKLKIS